MIFYKYIMLIVLPFVAAFFIQFMSMTEVREDLQKSNVDIISKVFNCDFCLSFWVNFLFYSVFILSSGVSFWYLILITYGTVTTKKFI